MTIEDTSSKNAIVTGGYAVGATISITFPFDEPDTICVETDELGELVYNTDYEIVETNVVLKKAIGASDKVQVYRKTPMSQDRDIPQNAKFNSVSIEKALDKLTMQNQEQETTLSRCLKVPTFSDTTPEEMVEKVELVADNMEAVRTVSTNIENVNTVSDNIAQVKKVSDSISNVNTVADSITDVVNVSANISYVTTVSTNISSVKTVAEDIIAVKNTSDNITEIKTVNENITTIQLLANNIDELSKIATNDNINTVATNIDPINILGTTTNISAVKDVAGDIASVVLVSQKLDDLVDVASKTSQILTSVDNAQTWAEGTDEEVQLLGGVHSSKRWAEVSKTGLPDQTGHSGQYLSTNGTSAQWKKIEIPTGLDDGVLVPSCYVVGVPKGSYAADGTEYDSTLFPGVWNKLDHISGNIDGFTPPIVNEAQFMWSDSENYTPVKDFNHEKFYDVSFADNFYTQSPFATLPEGVEDKYSDEIYPAPQNGRLQSDGSYILWDYTIYVKYGEKFINYFDSVRERFFALKDGNGATRLEVGFRANALYIDAPNSSSVTTYIANCWANSAHTSKNYAEGGRYRQLRVWLQAYPPSGGGTPDGVFQYKLHITDTDLGKSLVPADNDFPGLIQSYEQDLGSYYTGAGTAPGSYNARPTDRFASIGTGAYTSDLGTSKLTGAAMAEKYAFYSRYYENSRWSDAYGSAEPFLRTLTYTAWDAEVASKGYTTAFAMNYATHKFKVPKMKRTLTQADNGPEVSWSVYMTKG